MKEMIIRIDKISDINIYIKTPDGKTIKIHESTIEDFINDYENKAFREYYQMTISGITYKNRNIRMIITKGVLRKEEIYNIIDLYFNLDKLNI